ncbi:hypothetical protein [Streptomyces sp. NPDC127038]|uniref:hypothetical protein n=1 Tax=Streptomyces sp. NPDC127038 TaxID=3347114 RepID=UPI003652B312
MTGLMAALDDAVKRRDWRAARAARAAAWDEVDRLADYLTRDERQRLWNYKRQIVVGEAQDRRLPGPADRPGNRPAPPGA